MMTGNSNIISASNGVTKPTGRPRVVYWLPAPILLGLGLIFVWGLARDPQAIPSALIGKSIPEFNLPPVQGRVLGLSSTNLKGEVSLVNVFASWCVACRGEHPLLLAMKADGVVPIHGLN